MRIFICIFLFLNIIPQASQAQNEEFTFGKVPPGDLRMKSYSGDEEAEALILYDKGELHYRIDPNTNRINTVFTRTRRIKIFKQSATELANIVIYFFKRGYNQNQKIYDIRAFSYGIDENGYQQRELNLGNVYEEKLDNEWYRKTFSIPNVKEGSIIEYKYTTETQSSNHIPDWNFQSSYPTRHSECIVKLIPFYEYTYLLQGRTRFYSSESKKGGLPRRYGNVSFQDMIYRFVMKNLPAFKDESFITSVNDYIIKLDWQLSKIHYPNGVTEEVLTSWPKMSNDFLKYEHYGKYIQASERAAKKLLSSDLKLGDLSPVEKAKEITGYVKENFRWDGTNRRYTDKSVKEFLREKNGSSAEINLFLVGLLRAAGLNTEPVLISTRSNGKIKLDYPFESFFNTSIALVDIDGEFYLTEATESALPFGLLPAEYLNERGLIIKKNSESWVTLSESSYSTRQENTIMQLDLENERINSRFQVYLTGYDAAPYRKNHLKFVQEMGNDYEVNEDISAVNQEQAELPLTLKFQASTPLELAGDAIYMKPFLDRPPSENPLKASKRTYPVDMIYRRKLQFNSTIAIPEGYKLESAPENQKFDNSLVSFSYSSELVGQTVKFSASYTLKKAVYQPSEYKNLRNNLDKIFNKLNEMMVLKAQ